MDQQYSLHWNNYVRQITEAFDTLRNDVDFVDVTLSCEGRKIKAHKMLLSACSVYFRDIFKDNPCQHPVIVFRDVKYKDLSAIVDFMYKGEVNVCQDQLESFIRTAELLEVKGLSEGEDEPSSGLMNEQKTVPQETISRLNQPDVSYMPLTSKDMPPQKKRKYSDPSEPKLAKGQNKLTAGDDGSCSLAEEENKKLNECLDGTNSKYEELGNVKSNSSLELNTTSSNPKMQGDMMLGEPDHLMEDEIQGEKQAESAIAEIEDGSSGAKEETSDKHEPNKRGNTEEPMYENDSDKEQQKNKEETKSKDEVGISKKLATPLELSEIKRLIPESTTPNLTEQSKKEIKLPKGLTVTVNQTQPFEDIMALRSENAKTPIHEEAGTEDQQEAGEGPEGAHEAPGLTADQATEDEPPTEPEFDYYGCETCKAEEKHPDPKAFTHKCPICPCVCYCAHLLKEHMRIIHGWFNVQRRFNQY